MSLTNTVRFRITTLLHNTTFSPAICMDGVNGVEKKREFYSCRSYYGLTCLTLFFQTSSFFLFFWWFKRRPGIELPRRIRDAGTGEKASQAVRERAARGQGFRRKTAPKVQPERTERTRQRHSAGETGQTGEIQSRRPSDLFADDQ